MAIAFVGSAEGSATNGGNVTLSLPSSGRIINNYVGIAVTLGTSRATALTVTTSSGASYSQIVTTVNSSFARFGYFRRIMVSTGETSVTVNGTGGSSDSTTAVAMIFSGVNTTTPEDATATSTTGSGTTPDSPSITVVSSTTGIISAVGAQVTDTAVTAPTSFVNQFDINANDTWDSTTGQAWITYSSTSPFNPTSWTNFTNSSWVAATIALRPIFASTSPEFYNFIPVTREYHRTIEIVGY